MDDDLDPLNIYSVNNLFIIETHLTVDQNEYKAGFQYCVDYEVFNGGFLFFIAKIIKRTFLCV